MSRRYPLAALVEATGLTEARLGRMVGLSGTTLKNAREQGLLESSADRYAIRAGLHPFVVWPEMADEAGQECASTDCDEWFVPRDTKGQQRYCSTRCRRREDKRRQRATERGAEYGRQIRRAYYWSDPKIRQRQAEDKASARRAAAARKGRAA